jgi:hypothetical protein
MMQDKCQPKTSDQTCFALDSTKKNYGQHLDKPNTIRKQIMLKKQRKEHKYK